MIAIGDLSTDDVLITNGDDSCRSGGCDLWFGDGRRQAGLRLGL